MSGNQTYPVSRVLGATALAGVLVAIPAVAGEVHLGGLASAPTHQRFIVTYREGSRELAGGRALASQLRALASAVPARRGRAVGLEPVRRLAVGPELLKANRPLDPAEAEVLMRRLAAEPNVMSVEVDQRLQPALSPDDPRLPEQWGLGTGSGIHARSAWDEATGRGVVVAVVDTGVTRHPDLQANLLPGYDFISDSVTSRDGDGRDGDPADEGDWIPLDNDCGAGSRARDSSWHGTHVAGIVAAVANNAIGVAGTAFDAKIVPVRALGRCGGFTSDVADAITWASGGAVGGVPANANPAEVINLSLGGQGRCSPTYQAAINGAVSRGVTVVVAAGNAAGSVANAVPANCDNVIAVAALTANGGRAGFSNFGDGIDVYAPGAGILSTFNTGRTTPGEANYAMNDGTSMAAPHVSGIVALMQSVTQTALPPATVESLLKLSTRSPSQCVQDCGSSIVHASQAITAVRSWSWALRRPPAAGASPQGGVGAAR